MLVNKRSNPYSAEELPEAKICKYEDIDSLQEKTAEQAQTIHTQEALIDRYIQNSDAARNAIIELQEKLREANLKLAKNETRKYELETARQAIRGSVKRSNNLSQRITNEKKAFQTIQQVLTDKNNKIEELEARLDYEKQQNEILYEETQKASKTLKMSKQIMRYFTN